MDANVFLKIVMAALIIESLCETLKMTWQNGKLNLDRVIALVVALVVCVGTGADLMAAAGLEFKFFYIGNILTAILASRGASFIHDLVSGIGNIYQNTKR